MTSGLFVWASERWCEVDAKSGRVAGWRRRARFVYRCRGRLQVASSAAVLRGLRALLAGKPGSVRDGAPLPQLRVNHRPHKEQCRVCATRRCSDTHHESGINNNKEAGKAIPPPTTIDAGVQVTQTLAQGSQASRPPRSQGSKPPQDSRPERSTSPELPPVQRRVFADVHKSNDVSQKHFESKMPSQSQVSQACKELIINEEDVDIYRSYLIANDPNFDLYRFDSDESYKLRVFFRINPLVNVERSLQIERMLRLSQSSQMTLKDFATKLGLQSISENESEKRRYKMRKRTKFIDEENDKENQDRSLFRIENNDQIQYRKRNSLLSRSKKILRERKEKKKQMLIGSELRRNISKLSKVIEVDSSSNSGFDKRPPRRDLPKPFASDSGSDFSKERYAEKKNPPLKKIPVKFPIPAALKRPRCLIPYSNLEDHAIVSWVSNGNRASLVNGNQLWRELQAQYESLVGRGRTWHSLRNRYLRYILPALTQLALPPAHAARLRAAAAHGAMKKKSVSRRNSIFAVPTVRSAFAARPRHVHRDDESDASDFQNQRVTRSSGVHSPDTRDKRDHSDTRKHDRNNRREQTKQNDQSEREQDIQKDPRDQDTRKEKHDKTAHNEKRERKLNDQRDQGTRKDRRDQTSRNERHDKNARDDGREQTKRNDQRDQNKRNDQRDQDTRKNHREQTQAERGEKDVQKDQHDQNYKHALGELMKQMLTLKRNSKGRFLKGHNQLTTSSENRSKLKSPVKSGSRSKSDKRVSNRRNSIEILQDFNEENNIAIAEVNTSSRKRGRTRNTLENQNKSESSSDSEDEKNKTTNRSAKSNERLSKFNDNRANRSQDKSEDGHKSSESRHRSEDRENNNKSEAVNSPRKRGRPRNTLESNKSENKSSDSSDDSENEPEQRTTRNRSAINNEKSSKNRATSNRRNPRHESNDRDTNDDERDVVNQPIKRGRTRKALESQINTRNNEEILLLSSDDDENEPKHRTTRNRSAKSKEGHKVNDKHRKDKENNKSKAKVEIKPKKRDRKSHSSGDMFEPSDSSSSEDEPKQKQNVSNKQTYIEDSTESSDTDSSDSSRESSVNSLSLMMDNKKSNLVSTKSRDKIRDSSKQNRRETLRERSQDNTVRSPNRRARRSDSENSLDERRDANTKNNRSHDGRQKSKKLEKPESFDSSEETQNRRETLRDRSQENLAKSPSRRAKREGSEESLDNRRNKSNTRSNRSRVRENRDDSSSKSKRKRDDKNKERNVKDSSSDDDTSETKQMREKRDRSNKSRNKSEERKKDESNQRRQGKRDRKCRLSSSEDDFQPKRISRTPTYDQLTRQLARIRSTPVETKSKHKQKMRKLFNPNAAMR